MKRACVMLGLLGACSGHESSTPPKEPPSASAAAESAEDPVPSGDPRTPWHWEAAQPSPDPSYLLGVVGQDGVQHCAKEDPFDVEWKKLHPTVGRVDVSGPPPTVFDPFMDQPVLAVGVPLTTPHPLASGDAQPCAPMQMRSDWRQTPRGILIERSAPPSIGHFEVTAVRALREVTARADGEHVVVEVQNPVPVELTEVELRVHYEGCFGKPGTIAETEQIGTLGIGAQVSARVPQLGSRAGARGSFIARSVQLVASGESVVVDLDISLASLGVSLSCPGRGG